MKKYRVLDKSNVFSASVEGIREYLEISFGEKFEFLPMFQESEDEGNLEIYLHTDTYEILKEQELTKLEQMDITESDSLKAICSILGIRKIKDFQNEERGISLSFFIKEELYGSARLLSRFNSNRTIF
ncbi:hypothetical protein [Cytobacillus firmus]|uniref:hypothetical protein n=1 Tax=Cytobacillus firmus TaxID=1399 RepID=UPI0030014A9B